MLSRVGSSVKRVKRGRFTYNEEGKAGTLYLQRRG
jgi:hypothetical protein